jgi:hypothetical protein
MFTLLLSMVGLLFSAPDIRELALENLALRQQLVVMKRKCPRPRLRRVDRLFWVWLSGVWNNWREALVIVRPETVVSWHRRGFRLFWTWISRRRRSGWLAGSIKMGLWEYLRQVAVNARPKQTSETGKDGTRRMPKQGTRSVQLDCSERAFERLSVANRAANSTKYPY